MQFINIVLPLLVAVATAAPTQSTSTTQDAPSRIVEKRSTKYTDTVNPDKPHMSYESQCIKKKDYDAVWAYNVVIQNAKKYTKGGCGSGFLDNLHGQGCTITNWGCNYATDSSGMDFMEANFQGDLGCDGGDVGSAIWKAFGHLKGIDCVDYDSISGGDLPPVDLPVGV
ncbi:hypothetical protein P280DRAFT_522089 [Massarina eburnea CBS 473.64]|uniref:Ecp2 effector protein domain-containing protein n=1 Tax=Massarina eburnea CBS 473.64 TaxID=1395130 RepID=A0A6A6RMR3_9PLEO|nr:hypothetical protein P280DRAFT_522089 [Massarina eburnea CBS 473.64]